MVAYNYVLISLLYIEAKGTEMKNCSSTEVPSDGPLVRSEEIGIVIVVMMIWLWSCVLAYIRYDLVKFSCAELEVLFACDLFDCLG